MRSRSPFKRSRRAALAGFLVATPSLAPIIAAAAEPTKGTFIVRILEQNVGREEFEILPAGWAVKGSFDLFGQTKADYEISEKRDGDTKTLSIRGTQNGRKDAVDVTFTSEKVETRIEGAPPRSYAIEGKPAPLPFQNLIWGYLIDIGQELAGRMKAGTLKSGEALELIEVVSLKTLPLAIRDFSLARCLHDGNPVGLYAFEVTLAGAVDGTLVTSTSGVPLFFGVPAQKLEVVVEGWEAAKPAATSPHTIVDSGPWRSLLSKPEHAVTVEKKILIRMRDGTKLAADVYRPEKEGKHPTVLSRTPYSRGQMGLFYGSFYASRGYVYVTQDVRGRFDSEGKFEPMRREAEDGSDTIDWIAAQPWSNGDVGMIGASYVGWTQWAAAKSGNRRLKAIIPQVAPPDPQYNIPYMGGVFVLGSAWWARVAEDMSRLGNEKLDWNEAFATLPLTDLDKTLALTLPILDDWISHPPHDPWWDVICYQKDFSKLNVPALNISGWYDGDLPGAPSNFIGMRKSAASERARKGQWLVMGPWTHLFNSSSRIGDLDFGPDAVVDLQSLELRWFDHYLKGIDSGIDREDPVLLFTMGENRWRREKDWPLPQTKWTKLYLGGPGKANQRDGGGTLALEPDPSSPPDRYDYDPARLPDIKVDFDDLSGKQATEDLSTLPDRDDELDFISPPLLAPVEITGPVSAVLSVTTDAKDTDFVVGLLRVSPSSRTTAIRGGIRRLRYRSGYDKEDFAKPGELSTLTIDLWATSLRLEAGDRLAVRVASSGFPSCARNLNTGEPDATATKMVVARQTVFHDAKRPSYVVLPVIPREGTSSELRFAASEATSEEK
jgi:putative CocE/NonD family hydrolase